MGSLTPKDLQGHVTLATPTLTV